MPKLRALIEKIKECQQTNEQLEPQIGHLIKAYEEVLEPGKKFTNTETGHLPQYKGYDAWIKTFDEKKEYESTYNWLLIASAGDPTKWKGVEVTAKKGLADMGLAGSLHDLVSW